MSHFHQLWAISGERLIQLLTLHLWESAAVALPALVAAVALRKAPARMRWALWVAILVMLVTPPMFLSAAADRTWSLVHRAPPAALVTRTAMSLAPLTPSGVPDVIAENGHRELACAVLVLYSSAVLLLLGRSWVAYQALRRAADRATISSRGPLVVRLSHWSSVLGMRVRVIPATSRSITDPAIVGLFRPLLIVPEHLLHALDQDELDGLIVHELAHARCGDNLVGLLATLASCFFWFSPLLWVVRSRLLVEREYACDELAVSVTRNPRAYASTVAKASQLSIRLDVLAVSRAGGGRLAQRLRHIADHVHRVRPTRPELVILAVFTLTTITVCAATATAGHSGAGGTMASAAGTQATTPSLSGGVPAGFGSAADQSDRSTVELHIVPSPGLPVTLVRVQLASQGSLIQAAATAPRAAMRHLVAPIALIRNDSHDTLTGVSVSLVDNAGEHHVFETHGLRLAAGQRQDIAMGGFSIARSSTWLSLQVERAWFNEPEARGGAGAFSREPPHREFQRATARADRAGTVQPVGPFGMPPPPAIERQRGIASPTEPAVAVSGMVLKLGGGALQLRATRAVQPTAVRHHELHPVVVVEVLVNERGEVESALPMPGERYGIVTTSDSVLEGAAVRAARQWRFSPGKFGGTPAKMFGELYFRF
jgi:beta-lactamase regulating signal transducer with metallopeptidase domain